MIAYHCSSPPTLIVRLDSSIEMLASNWPALEKKPGSGIKLSNPNQHRTVYFVLTKCQNVFEIVERSYENEFYIVPTTRLGCI